MNYSKEVETLLDIAAQIATEDGLPEVRSTQLLLALTRLPESHASQMLARLHVTSERIAQLYDLRERQGNNPNMRLSLAKRFVLENAVESSWRNGGVEVTSVDIVSALLYDTQDLSFDILQELNLNFSAWQSAIAGVKSGEIDVFDSHELVIIRSVLFDPPLTYLLSFRAKEIGVAAIAEVLWRRMYSTSGLLERVQKSPWALSFAEKILSQMCDSFEEENHLCLSHEKIFLLSGTHHSLPPALAGCPRCTAIMAMYGNRRRVRNFLTPTMPEGMDY